MVPTITITLIGALLFGYLSRIIGSPNVGWFNPFKDYVYAFPFGVLAVLALLTITAPLWVLIVVYLLAAGGAFLGKRTGHGQWMDLGTWLKEVTPEKLDFIVKVFFGEDTYNSYWRDFFGLTVSGVAIVLVTSIVLAVCGFFGLALGLLIGGAFKSVSYAIGWRFFKETPTEVGEFFTGFFSGLPLFYAIASFI